MRLVMLLPFAVLLLLGVAAAVVAGAALLAVWYRRRRDPPIGPKAPATPGPSPANLPAASDERRRILNLLRDGRVTTAEAEALLDAVGKSPNPAAAPPATGVHACPYCAEEIPATSLRCPQCRSDLATPLRPEGVSASGGQSGPLLRALAVYMLVVCTLAMAGSGWRATGFMIGRDPFHRARFTACPLQPSRFGLCSPLLAPGMPAEVLPHLVGRSAGAAALLGTLLPAALAAVGLVGAVLILRDQPVGWWLGATWAACQVVTVWLGGLPVNRVAFSLYPVHWFGRGGGVALNLVGVVLLVLFIVARRDLPQARAEGGPGFA